MRYYVYFDGYEYSNDPDEFLRAMSGHGPEARTEHTTGHVSTLRFDNEKELNDYLESLGDEITGFYGCQSESRPYNF